LLPRSEGTISIPLSATLLENIDGFPAVLLPSFPTDGANKETKKDSGIARERVDLVIKIGQDSTVYAVLGTQAYVPLGGLDAQPMKTNSVLLMSFKPGSIVSYADSPSMTRVLTADSSVTRQAIDILLKPRDEGGFGAIFLYGRYFIPIAGGDRLKRNPSLRERHAITSKIVQLVHHARSWKARVIQLQTKAGALNKFVYALGKSELASEDEISADQTSAIGRVPKQDGDGTQAGTGGKRPDRMPLADAMMALQTIEKSGGLTSMQSKSKREEQQSGADLGVFYRDETGQLRGFYSDAKQARAIYAALYSAGYSNAVRLSHTPGD
jgi:hypothetical protein